MHLILNVLIWGTLIFGLISSIPLVNSEIKKGNICPKIMGLPACYIILSCLIIAALSHANLIRPNNTMYFIFVIIPLSIAIFGTIGNILGKVECPKTGNGIPMCYISFAMFSILLICKIIILKT